MFTHTAIVQGAPAVEPATAAEVLTFGRIDDSDESTFIDGLIVAARESIEAMTGRALINRTVTAYFDDWPDKTAQHDAEIWLPLSPVSAIASVKYYDASNVLQTWAATNYDTDFRGAIPRITLGYGKTWPTLRSRTNAVIVEFTAGYGAAASSVPRALRLAVQAAAVSLYERRDQYIEGASELRENKAIANLIASYRIQVAY